MSIKSFPWDSSSGDRQYTALNWQEYFNLMFGTGVVIDVLNECEVTAVTGELKAQVDTGLSYLEGIMGYVYAVEQPTFTPPATGTRYDRVVKKIDRTTRDVTVYVKTGTDLAPPALTRDANNYEISLAKLTLIAGMTDLNSAGCAITDERSDASVCGYINRLNQNKVDTLYDTTTPKLNGSFAGFSQAHGTTFAAVSDGINLWVCGGDSYVAFLSKYDQTSWSAKTNMTTGRNRIGLTYYSGKLYAIGGVKAGNTDANENECYDISGNSWSVLTDKPTACGWHAQVLLNGIIYCFGGVLYSGTFIKKVEAYTISTDGWATLADLPSTPSTYYFSVSACTDGTNIYIAYYDGANKFVRYNVGANNYTTLTPESLSGNVAHLVFMDGYIYAFTSAGAILRYTIATDTWVAVTALSGSPTGFPTITYPRHICQYTDRRFAYPMYTGTNSVLFTYYYYIGQIGYNCNISIRKKAHQTLEVCNISTLQASDVVGFRLNDLYGLFCNDKTVNGAGYAIELMA